MIQGQFQIHFHSSLIKHFKNIKKYESSHSTWYDSEQQVSFEVFDNFSKVYVSVEDFTLVNVYVDLHVFTRIAGTS